MCRVGGGGKEEEIMKGGEGEPRWVVGSGLATICRRRPKAVMESDGGRGGGAGGNEEDNDVGTHRWLHGEEEEKEFTSVGRS